jgi:hypothetical protein
MIVVDTRFPELAEVHFQQAAAPETTPEEGIPDFSSALSHALHKHRTLVHRSTDVRALTDLVSNCAKIAPASSGGGSPVSILQAWGDIIQGRYAPARYVESYTSGAVRVSFMYSPRHPSRKQQLKKAIERLLGWQSSESGSACFELTIERCDLR